MTSDEMPADKKTHILFIKFV